MGGSGIGSILGILIIIIVLILSLVLSLFLYFLPSIIARKKDNFTVIILLNMFLCWIPGVWLIILIVAIASGRKIANGGNNVIIQQNISASGSKKKGAKNVSQNAQQGTGGKNNSNFPTWLIILLGVFVLIFILVFVGLLIMIFAGNIGSFQQGYAYSLI